MVILYLVQNYKIYIYYELNLIAYYRKISRFLFFVFCLQRMCLYMAGMSFACAVVCVLRFCSTSLQTPRQDVETRRASARSACWSEDCKLRLGCL